MNRRRVNVKHLEMLHRLSKEPYATELRHRRTPPRLPLHSGNQVSSLRRIDWSDQSAVAILLCSPTRNTAFVARGLAQKRLPPANGGITSPEHENQDSKDFCHCDCSSMDGFALGLREQPR